MIIQSITPRFRRYPGRGGAVAISCALTLISCGGALEFTDPDIILEANSAAGAVALKNGVIGRFGAATSGGESTFFFGGLLTDEWRSGDTFEQRNGADSRTVAVTNSFLGGQLRALMRVRVQGREAVDALRAFSPSPLSNIGLMFALIAFSENQVGETYCNGIPFSDVSGGAIIFGEPVPVDSAFKRAVNSADSALVNGGTAGSAVGNLAAVIKGRALLNLGQYAAAAAAVAAVPTSFVYQAFHSDNSGNNQIWALNTSAKRYVVGDNEGGNGLPFRSANDPRLPTTAGGNAFDANTPFISQSIWLKNDPVTVASGIEARMIEAEAALKANDVPTFLAKLDNARATKAGLITPIADPGTQTAREDLLFRERAFWFWGTGHRLGDLRRLIRQYGRNSESVFPTGPWFKGDNYGPDVNLPVSFEELNNPAVPQDQVKSSCIDRNA